MPNINEVMQTEPDKGRMMVTLTVGQLRDLMVEAVKQALNTQPPPKLQFTLKEAAAILNVTETLLSDRCRAGTVPFHRIGHLYRFTKEDIDEIIASTAVKRKEQKGGQ